LKFVDKRGESLYNKPTNQIVFGFIWLPTLDDPSFDEKQHAILLEDIGEVNRRNEDRST